jgi:hypothetical protein
MRMARLIKRKDVVESEAPPLTPKSSVIHDSAEIMLQWISDKRRKNERRSPRQMFRALFGDEPQSGTGGF